MRTSQVTDAVESAPGPGSVLLVSSSGGHLSQLLALRQWWAPLRRTWVTMDTVDARSRLHGEDVIYAYGPTNRNIPNLLRNLALATRLVPNLNPDCVVSTGAAVAVPFFFVARTLGIPSAFVEVYDRISTPTISGRLCYPLADVFCVQWPQQLRIYQKAVLIGPLI